MPSEMRCRRSARQVEAERQIAKNEEVPRRTEGGQWLKGNGADIGGMQHGAKSFVFTVNQIKRLHFLIGALL